ncbi:M14 family metallopeptidase [Aliikangiella maris]|uniref:M14 family metallocarboxypeptidase n=2 Tax=Aliikangiella maris TaxID=3162458 RepID=A0ABV3MRV5_9GAMM
MTQDNQTNGASSSSSSLTQWGDKERQDWFQKQVIKRSYQDEVVSKIKTLTDKFEIIQYGSLSCNPEQYPLFAIKSLNWDANKPTILVTGGVHGYETSGVHGALGFAEQKALQYPHYNFVITPCISPWGYETINRWNNLAIDPNRSFYQNSPAEESANLMAFIQSLNTEFLMHIDLHETTDTDNQIFLPALAARDGVKPTIWEIPDGFYVVGDAENPADEFQKAIIQSVENVTHIAPSDNNNRIIGEPVSQHGVINYMAQKLFLCMGFTGAKYCSTTEVYPDSPKVTPQECIDAQIAAVIGGLNYLDSLNS